jgi:FkbM family methyltransferase
LVEYAYASDELVWENAASNAGSVSPLGRYAWQAAVKPRSDCADWLCHRQATRSIDPVQIEPRRTLRAATVALFRQYLRPGDTFIDIGANIGYFSLLAASRVGSTGQVHSFEPNPETFKGLQHNVVLNGFKQIVLNNVAISNAAGPIQLWVGKEIDNGLVSMRQTSSLLTDSVMSQATTLDEYVSNHRVGKNPRDEIRCRRRRIVRVARRVEFVSKRMQAQHHCSRITPILSEIFWPFHRKCSTEDVIKSLTRARNKLHLLVEQPKSACLFESVSDSSQLSNGTLVAFLQQTSTL